MRRDQRGYTLAEVMISMTIFGMVIAALVAVQWFGLKQNQLVESKLGASDQARKLLERMGWEIRSSKTWQLGTVSGSTFTGWPSNITQRATAIRLTMPSTNIITYYFNTNTRILFRREATATPTVVAQDLTNNMFFQVETWYGAVALTNDSRWRACIRVMLEFAQYQFPLTQVGPGSYYDYYKMEYKISPHSPSP